MENQEPKSKIGDTAAILCPSCRKNSATIGTYGTKDGDKEYITLCKECRDHSEKVEKWMSRVALAVVLIYFYAVYRVFKWLILRVLEIYVSR